MTGDNYGYFSPVVGHSSKEVQKPKRRYIKWDYVENEDWEVESVVTELGIDRDPIIENVNKIEEKKEEKLDPLSLNIECGLMNCVWDFSQAEIDFANRFERRTIVSQSSAGYANIPPAKQHQKEEEEVKKSEEGKSAIVENPIARLVETEDPTDSFILCAPSIVLVGTSVEPLYTFKDESTYLQRTSRLEKKTEEVFDQIVLGELEELRSILDEEGDLTQCVIRECGSGGVIEVVSLLRRVDIVSRECGIELILPVDVIGDISDVVWNFDDGLSRSLINGSGINGSVPINKRHKGYDINDPVRLLGSNTLLFTLIHGRRVLAPGFDPDVAKYSCKYKIDFFGKIFYLDCKDYVRLSAYKKFVAIFGKFYKTLLKKSQHVGLVGFEQNRLYDSIRVMDPGIYSLKLWAEGRAVLTLAPPIPSLEPPLDYDRVNVLVDRGFSDNGSVIIAKDDYLSDDVLEEQLNLLRGFSVVGDEYHIALKRMIDKFTRDDFLCDQRGFVISRSKANGLEKFSFAPRSQNSSYEFFYDSLSIELRGGDLARLIIVLGYLSDTRMGKYDDIVDQFPEEVMASDEPEE